MSNEPAWPWLPPKGPRRNVHVAGWLTAAVAMLWLLVVLPIYTLRGPDSGPRWMAGSDLVIYVGILALFIGVIVGIMTDRDRGLSNFLFAGVGLVAMMLVIADLPNAVADAFGPFESRTIDVTEWTISSNGTATIRTADGETLSGPNGFGVVRPTAMPNGRYDVLLTASSRTVVAATPHR